MGRAGRQTGFHEVALGSHHVAFTQGDAAQARMHVILDVPVIVVGHRIRREHCLGSCTGLLFRVPDSRQASASPTWSVPRLSFNSWLQGLACNALDTIALVVARYSLARA